MSAETQRPAPGQRGAAAPGHAGPVSPAGSFNVVVLNNRNGQVLLLKPIPILSQASRMALGCSEETVVETHVIMFNENPKAKANVPGSDRLCVAPICTPAFAPSRGISIIPFFSLNNANSSLTHLHAVFRLIRTTLLTAQ